MNTVIVKTIGHVRGRGFLAGALAVAISGAFAGCGDSQTQSKELAKPGEASVKLQNQMSDFYKTNPPGKAAKK